MDKLIAFRLNESGDADIITFLENNPHGKSALIRLAIRLLITDIDRNAANIKLQNANKTKER